MASGFLARTVVLIPALDEAASVGVTVARWRVLGAGRVRVVDNGSRDATARLAAEAGAEVLAAARRGYGAAAWTGFQHWPEGFDWVLFSSADGSDRLEEGEVPVWQQAVDGGARLMLGDRTARPDARRHLKPTQRFGNALCCAAIAAGWRRRFRDMAALRLARHADLMALGLEDRGFGWNLEMQVKAVEAGWSIVELPVGYHPRMAGESKISGSFAGTWRAGVGITKMLLQLARLRRSAVAREAARLAEARAA